MDAFSDVENDDEQINNNIRGIQPYMFEPAATDSEEESDGGDSRDEGEGGNDPIPMDFGRIGHKEW